MTGNPEEHHAYCRQVEAYLQKKNDGHLVRIVGPAFEKVLGWAGKGVPLTAVYRGVDRYFERYYAKGPQRRPVRIEFCEADVLDVFDEWRRAVGVPMVPEVPGVPGVPGEEDVASAFRRKDSLSAHLERVVARLTALRAGERGALDALVDTMVRELDGVRATAKGVRGEARAVLLERLRALDAQLVTAARDACDAATLDALGDAADAELAPFRARMPQDAYARSRQSCIDQLLRERAKLPVVAFE
jgi:hypothetical protein